MESYLNDTPVPEEGERIVKVVESRGSNILQVQCPDGTKALAMLPTKFRKLIWVKRGDFLIVSESQGDVSTASGGSGKVKFMVSHVLHSRDQRAHLQSTGHWPGEFALDSLSGNPKVEVQGGAVEAPASTSSRGENKEMRTSAKGFMDSEEESDDDADLFVNTNRIAQVEYDQDSESEEESDYEDPKQGEGDGAMSTGDTCASLSASTADNISAHNERRN